ncbi:MAG: ATP/GTP-binding protein [Lewinella sp.]
MSIKEPVTLNFEAASITDHLDSNVVDKEDAKVLKSLLLYGHNASGKSNILKALVYLRWLIVKSATDMNVGDDFAVTPFLLDDVSENKPSFFEVGFALEGVRYRYGIEVNKKEVQREWLLEATRKKYYPVFLRGGQEFEIDDKRLKNSKGLEARTRKNALFLSVCAQWSVDKAEEIITWFDSIYAIHGLNDAAYRKTTIQLMQSEKYSHIGKALLKAADLGINDVEFGEVDVAEMVKQIPVEMRETVEGQLKDQDRTVVFVNKNVYADGEKIAERPFILDQSESDGTIKYFNLLGAFIAALLENRLVIIDEFDARLHTLLSKAILQVFNSNETKTSAQLLLACHDTALIDKDILRRDQIYFIEKNKFGATRVNSLVEFKVRKETAFGKNYLNGKYGGIPILSDLKKAYDAKVS